MKVEKVDESSIRLTLSRDEAMALWAAIPIDFYNESFRDVIWENTELDKRVAFDIVQSIEVHILEAVGALDESDGE